MSQNREMNLVGQQEGVRYRPRASLLRMSALARLGLGTLLVAVIWLAVFWATGTG